MRKFYALPIVTTAAKVAFFLAIFYALSLTARAQCASTTQRVVTYQQPQVMTYVQKIPITTTYLPPPVTYQPPPVTTTTYQYQVVQTSACATVATSACASGHVGLFARMHERKADRHEAKAEYHQARADHLSARRGAGVTVMVGGEGTPMMMQPQGPAPYPPVEKGEKIDPPKKMP